MAPLCTDDLLEKYSIVDYRRWSLQTLMIPMGAGRMPLERTGEGGRTQSPGPGLGQDRQKRAWVVTGRLADWGAGREIQKVRHLLHSEERSSAKGGSRGVWGRNKET